MARRAFQRAIPASKWVGLMRIFFVRRYKMR
jgi:hypothetical protein